MRPERTTATSNRARCLWPFWLCALKVVSRGNCGTHLSIWYELIKKHETTDEELVACGWVLPLERNARMLALDGLRAARKVAAVRN